MFKAISWLCVIAKGILAGSCPSRGGGLANGFQGLESNTTLRPKHGKPGVGCKGRFPARRGLGFSHKSPHPRGQLREEAPAWHHGSRGTGAMTLRTTTALAQPRRSGLGAAQVRLGGQRLHRIRLDLGIDRHQGQAMVERLTDQQPIEGITMQVRQTRQMQNARLIQGQ